MSSPGISYQKWPGARTATGMASLLSFAAICAFCVAVLWLTEPRMYADTASYALHIVQHPQNHAAPGKDQLWEFAHVLWRPLGYVLWRSSGGMHSADPVLQAARVLIAISTVFTFAGTILLYFLAANYTGKPWVGFVTAAGLLAAHAVLNYGQAGTPFIPGLVCQVAALFWLERQLRHGRDKHPGTWLVTGFLLGISIALAFIYSLTAPSVLAFALLYRAEKPRDRAGLLIRSAAVCAAVLIAAYTLAVVSDGITSFSMARAWYVSAQHGVTQNRGYLRFVTGLPRTFFWLGNDAVLWKRLLFHRSSGIGSGSLLLLILQIAWKLLLVYAFLLVIGIELARASDSGAGGRRLFAVLLIAAAPVFIFAVLFEAGEGARYLGVFPVLFLGVAHVLGRVRRPVPSAIVGGFLAAMLAVNVTALSRAGSDARSSATVAKLVQLTQRSSPQDLLLVVCSQDDVVRLCEGRPFDPLMRRVPKIHIVTELGSSVVLTWRRDVANLILKSWQGGHRVWVSKRLSALRPRPEWNWVEGDDPRVHWADFPAYFSHLQTISECCGSDGFLLLAPTPADIAFLQSEASTAKPTRADR